MIESINILCLAPIPLKLFDCLILIDCIVLYGIRNPYLRKDRWLSYYYFVPQSDSV